MRGRDAGSLGAPTATAPRRSASSARRSAWRSRRGRPARARWLARMKAVEHPGPGSRNPGASRSCCCRRPSRRRGDPMACTIGVAGANVASVRRARCGLPGCIGIDGRSGGASPRAPSASRRDRSSADRGRSDCTAAPARGNAHTRTGGRDARPGSGLLGGKLPEATKTEPMPTLLALDDGVRQCNTGAAFATGVCRVRRAVLAARLIAAAVPAYSGQAVVLPRMAVPGHRRLAAGTPSPTQGRTSAADSKRVRLDDVQRQTQSDFIQCKTASSPSNRSGS
jgi:hypothetical protein